MEAGQPDDSAKPTGEGSPYSDQPTESSGDVASEGMPECVGPYRILERIGAGGMGVVYLAEQTEPVQRRIALKMIKLGMDTKDVIARFEFERRALALMNHPNIVRLYDAGATEKGRPYFAMEYVDGSSITEHADMIRLSIHDRLAVFNQVCEGLKHAHRQGIIHRCLKASDILVTRVSGRPLAKIIDFGVADTMDPEMAGRKPHTEHGRIIGTPEFMMPEVLDLRSGDANTGIDIYYLGMVLYELLVGVYPFDVSDLREGGLEEIRERMRLLEVPAPSIRFHGTGDASLRIAERRRTTPNALARLIRGELDRIVLKALAKDRSMRYASASDLGADIQRILSGDTARASLRKTANRFLKWIGLRR